MAKPDTLKEDDELAVVEDEPKEKPAAEPQGSTVEADDHEDDDEDPKSEDERDIDPDNPDAGDEREAIREQRRREKQERRVRRAEAIKRERLEMEFLRKRNDDLERRFSALEHQQSRQTMANVDAQIAHATREVNMAEEVIARAIKEGNGEDVTKALRYRDQAMERARQLAAHKQQALAQPQRQGQLEPEVANYAGKFLSDNKWYDPQGRDEDSAIVLAIDQAMAREGYDPRSADYWDELRKRVARRLPDKMKPPAQETQDDEPPRREARGGPAVGSGREHAPASSRREVYISPERKQALMDAGVWDDPQLRARYIRQYAEYDKLNRGR